MALGLLLLRVVIGLVMAAHGAQKWLGWFGGPGLEGTGGWLASMGFRPGRVNATAVAAAETVGGLLLVFGLLTPFGAAAVIGVMLVAVASVHWDKGFFNTEGGFEFNLTLAAAAAALAFTGPGRLSLDGALGFDMRGLLWGFTAIVLGGAAAGFALASRQVETEAASETDTTRELVVDLRESERERTEV